MSHPKFTIGQQVIVPHQDSKPHLFSGHGEVTNRFRINSTWTYQIKFDGGRVEEIPQARIEAMTSRTEFEREIQNQWDFIASVAGKP